METPPPSRRTQVRRAPQRGHYDRATIERILDESPICHIGLVQEGQPFVIPTIHARMGDRVVLHGAPGSRLLKYVRQGHPLCLTVTLLDGLVLARSAFHHSMNYRSVVLLAQGEVVEDEAERLAAFRAISEHVMPGRWDDVRGPNEVELKQTQVVSLPIDEASAKIRTGPPVEEEEDYALSMWAGVLPLRLTPGAPVPDPRLAAGTEVPDYVHAYSARAVEQDAEAHE